MRASLRPEAANSEEKHMISKQTLDQEREREREGDDLQ